jgi:hypothetical protein
MAPTLKLFISKRRFQRQRPQPQKTVLGLCPSKGIPVNQKLSMAEEWCQDQSWLFQRRDYRNKEHNLQKLSWVRVPVRLDPVAWKLSIIKNSTMTETVKQRPQSFKICTLFVFWRGGILRLRN